MSSSIQIQGLSKVYRTADGGEIRALYDVDLEVQAGEFVSIVGPSGCGKSTLLKMIAGLASKSSGSLQVADQEVAGPRSDLGFVFQSPVLLPWRTVLDNVLFPVEVQGKRKSDYVQRAKDTLQLVGLSEFASKYPYELSGGMQQRNALARALVDNPTLILMDEPFGALDAITRDQVSDELQRIWHEKRPTILFVTHSIPEAIFLSTRIVVFSARPGRIVGQMDIPFQGRRTLDLTVSPEFNRLVQQGRALLAGDTPTASAMVQ